MEKYLYNFQIAFDAIKTNTLRTVLTSLGMILGVGAVIIMLAIGEGTKQDILDQMKLVGVNNIVIAPLLNKKNAEEDAQSAKEKNKFSRGLTIQDAKAIREILPTAERVSPEVNYEVTLIKDGRSKRANLAGVFPDYFSIQNLELQSGSYFGEQHALHTRPVCVIGDGVRKHFFANEEPIGKYIKCGNIWLQVIGVLKKMNISEASVQSLGISNFNNQVYAPLETVLVRYRNRGLITQQKIQGGSATVFGGDFMITTGTSGEGVENTHQLDKIVVMIRETEYLSKSSEIIQRLLLRRHSQVEDFEIKIPELLLKQQRETKESFNVLLVAIASISLVIGGIGIMNIMLASVMERIKEIGIRLSIGATKQDIILQFMTEAILVSVSGGLIGVVLGIATAYIIPLVKPDTPTIITLFSIIVSFLVSVSVGIIFGFWPARRAAQMDPILSLRHD
ncbi:MAG: ABC transporter permease [Bacteroidota bacterium]